MWWPNKGKKVTLDPHFFNEKIAPHCTWPSSGTIGKPERTLYENFKSSLNPKQPPGCEEEGSCSAAATPS
ncbi:MAG: hypothetical protein GY782_00385 [Gammaproteobacteria bacterium]|nr:hypothetical protein [Gammaproteobacteria bacterium]